MGENSIVALVEKQDWLAPIQEKGQELVKSAYEAAGETGQAVKNALHGVWLGHPLHAAITDVPVGSWTAALVMDLFEAAGNDKYAAGADAAVAVGLVGAVGAAVSGLTDWSEIQGKPQRVGAMHGLMNMGAALLYSGSYAARKSGKRALGRGLGFAGYSIAFASAYLGGALSYNQKIGVNHSAEPSEDLPQHFTAVCSESELAEGHPKKVQVNGTPVMLLKRGATIFALAEKCSHLGGPLSEGEIEGDAVQCPWHGSRFCLYDGSVLDGPATTPQPALDVMVKDGQVLVRRQGEE
ncbi:MAG: Rieske 2Fe-2S domain-containing protein [Acidobacteriaceae bacterium]|nr:Rieske 2Fe-2S domain-containing protein [Acidobacteriaceae bacterium]